MWGDDAEAGRHGRPRPVMPLAEPAWRRPSSAWPLAALFAALVAYASLYPFEGWRAQGAGVWAFLGAPWPRYWTVFDVVANLLGYVPLGFLLGLAMRRSGWGRWSWPLSALLPALWSLALETLQGFLPTRVPSNLDLGLNALGGVIGASLVAVLDRLGGLKWWARWRDQWLDPGAHASLVLLLLWPLALLYPVSVPFGLGQVWSRLETALFDALEGTPFTGWMPLRVVSPVPLGTLAEAFCVALGLLAPVLLAYADLRTVGRRVLFLPLLLGGAWAAAGLSSALTYGPQHAWAWVTPQVLLGVGLACLVALAALGLSRRLSAAGLLLVLGLSLSLLNRSPESPYLAASLQTWEQGRFIRFHGLSQWLGWLWPYVAMLFGLWRVARR